MTLAEALTTIEREDQDLFALLSSIYAEKYTGMVILHCSDGVPRKAEFPSKQVRLQSGLDKGRSSP